MEIDPKLFTREAFIGWLLTRPIDEYIGTPSEPRDCPICHYAKALGYNIGYALQSISVGGHCIYFGSQPIATPESEALAKSMCGWPRSAFLEPATVRQCLQKLGIEVLPEQPQTAERILAGKEGKCI